MTNISQLEREWKVYKNKQRRPFIVSTIIASLLLLILLLIIFSSNRVTANIDQNKSYTIAHLPLTKETAKVESELNSTSTPTLPSPKRKSIQELRPSFDFMKQINEDPYKAKRTTPKKTHVSTNVKQNSKPLRRVNQYQNSRVSQNKIAVSSSSTTSKLSSLAKRFNNSRNPILGITIAKQYLKNKNYKQAYFYALEVNNIDRKNEDSWLVTAQALYFLNKKDASLKLLQNYLRNNNSSKALKLFRSIKQDRLK